MSEKVNFGGVDGGMHEVAGVNPWAKFDASGPVAYESASELTSYELPADAAAGSSATDTKDANSQYYWGPDSVTSPDVSGSPEL